jgi:hypothetical protein
MLREGRSAAFIPPPNLDGPKDDIDISSLRWSADYSLRIWLKLRLKFTDISVFDDAAAIDDAISGLLPD